jgi:hypothetical protein
MFVESLRPLVLFTAILERTPVGAAACEGPFEPHRTPVGLRDGAATREHGERHVGVVP